MGKERRRNVAVVGAGPVGLWTAAELRLGGVDVVVFDERSAPNPNSRALTIHPRTLEIFESRGVARQMLDEGLKIPNGHFAVLDHRLDFSPLDTPFPFTLALRQERTEQLLEAHARALGVEVHRNRRVEGVEVCDDGVALTTSDGTVVEADWLVGCDGVGSTVRTAAGIEFPGEDWSCLGWLGDVVLENPPAQGISVACPEGLLLGVPLPDGRLYRLAGISPEDVRTDWPGEFTLDELRDKVTRILGTDYGMHSPAWLSRYSNTARQAAEYRRGRALVAGDAAHQHMPAGGVGLNTGIQDAMNLGWKLAATATGRAPEWLLDTYHQERHPAGAAVLSHAQAQTALMTAFSTDGLHLRSLINELVRTHPSASLDLAKRLAGLSVCYPAAPGAHPLTGTRAPEMSLREGGSLLSALQPARFVVLDLMGSFDYAGKVVSARPITRPEWQGVEIALIRPDGHIAWAGLAKDFPEALEKWCPTAGSMPAV